MTFISYLLEVLLIWRKIMLKLTYNRSSDKFAEVTVLGSPEGIRDLYWQLTHNYSEHTDGTGIGNVKVTNLDGTDVTDSFISEPHQYGTRLDKNLEV
jgi:hypothetical protein